MPKLVVVVTGAATGMGALTARVLAKRGHIVYAGLRTLDAQYTSAIAEFTSRHHVDIRAIAQDMVSDSSVKASVEQILRETEGRLDVIVHNCGHMAMGPTEAFTPEQLAAQYDVNVLGTQRLNRAVLPHMRAERRGLVVWVSSTSVHGATPPFMAPYFAAKAGLDALAASYQPELARFGIESCIVVPGVFSRGTNHLTDAAQPADSAVARQYRSSGAPYEGVEDALVRAMAAFTADADPASVAERIADVVDMSYGTRPYRTHVDFGDNGAETVSEVRDRFRVDSMRQLGLGDLLSTKTE